MPSRIIKVAVIQFPKKESSELALLIKPLVPGSSIADLKVHIERLHDKLNNQKRKYECHLCWKEFRFDLLSFCSTCKANLCHECWRSEHEEIDEEDGEHDQAGFSPLIRDLTITEVKNMKFVDLKVLLDFCDGELPPTAVTKSKVITYIQANFDLRTQKKKKNGDNDGDASDGEPEHSND